MKLYHGSNVPVNVPNMKDYMVYFLDYYDKEIIKMIVEKYDISFMVALRRFLSSKTYKMLKNPELEMWDFSIPAIFDMQENENITGKPQSSVYLRGE